LTRMPLAMKSTASAFVRPMTAAFVAPYTYRFGAPLIEEAPDEMLMMEQVLFPGAQSSREPVATSLDFAAVARASIPGNRAFVIRCMDFTLRSNEKSQSASVHSSTEP